MQHVFCNALPAYINLKSTGGHLQCCLSALQLSNCHPSILFPLNQLSVSFPMCLLEIVFGLWSASLKLITTSLLHVPLDCELIGVWHKPGRHLRATLFA